jgi:hypothetical protein
MDARAPSWQHPEAAADAQGSEDGTWRSPGYRSSLTRARVAALLLLVGAVVDLIAALEGLRGIGLMDAAEAGTLTLSEAEAFDNSYATTGLAQLGLLAATAVAVLAWLSRVVENIPPLTGRTPRRGPRAAIGWWFVPIASLIVPYQIVADSARRLRLERSDGTERLLLPWWILWLVGGWLGNVLLRLPTETIDQLRTAYALQGLSDLISVAAAVLLVLVIRGMFSREQARAGIFGLGRSATPTWPMATARSNRAGLPPVVAVSTAPGWVSYAPAAPNAPETPTSSGPPPPPIAQSAVGWRGFGNWEVIESNGRPLHRGDTGEMRLDPRRWVLVGTSAPDSIRRDAVRLAATGGNLAIFDGESAAYTLRPMQGQNVEATVAGLHEP